jgi:Ni,Fe-hydrogenase III large subunit
VTSAWSVQHRLRDVGVLSPRRALEIGAVGVVARSSGQRMDARCRPRAGLYDAIPVTPVTLDAGDCWSRMMVRVAEMDSSLSWLRRWLDRSEELVSSRVSVGALAPDTLAIALVEGVRGEVVHCAETDATGALARYKLQDPSLRNWLGLALAVRDNEISDFPICNKSFDLSYCGNDL